MYLRLILKHVRVALHRPTPCDHGYEALTMCNRPTYSQIISRKHKYVWSMWVELMSGAGHTTLLRRWINVFDVDSTSQQRRVHSRVGVDYNWWLRLRLWLHVIYIYRLRLWLWLFVVIIINYDYDYDYMSLKIIDYDYDYTLFFRLRLWLWLQ